MQCPHDKTEMRLTLTESAGNGFFADSDETVIEEYVCPTCHHEYSVSYEQEDGYQSSTASMTDLTADEIWEETPHGEWVRFIPKPPTTPRIFGDL